MLILFLIVFIDLVGFGIIIPLLPFFAEHFHASPAMVGLLMATYSLTQFIAAPFWGRISDSMGRRPVLLITLGGSVIAYVILGFSDSLATLFIARALGGFMAGNISTAFAYIADITTAQNRAKGMGIIGAAFGLGFIAGPAIGGILAGPDPATADFRTPSLAAAALSLTALLLALVMLKESLSEEIRKRVAEMPRKKRMEQFHDALKRRCLYHWVDYPDAARELAIVGRKLPDLSAALSEQLVAFVQRLREEDLFKLPGIAETLDWAEALV